MKWVKLKKLLKNRLVLFPISVKAFNDISIMVASINDNIQNVSDASTSLYQNTQHASDVISDIASISEESAAGTEEVAASMHDQASISYQISDTAKELSVLANTLQNSIRKFNV